MLVVIAVSFDSPRTALFVRPFQKTPRADHVIECLPAVLAKLRSLGVGQGTHADASELREAVLVNIGMVRLAIDVGPKTLGVVGL